MPTLEIIRHSQTNECCVRIRGTTQLMYDDDGLTLWDTAPDALARAREYAARKGWTIDETLPPRHA